MLFKTIKIFCFILLCTRLTAQVNLIQNGSFEQISNCPSGFGYITNAYGWFRPSKGSSDLYNECGSNNANVPNGGYGFQYAQDGNGYAGGIFYDKYPNAQTDERENIAGTLTTPLKLNHYYCFKMYCSLAENGNFVISSAGVYFSPDSLYYDYYNPLPYTPQIENNATNFIADSSGWTLIEGYFKASGGEKYLYIGNFKDSANTVSLITPNNIGAFKSYFYIDNVQLYECDSLVGIDELPENPVRIYPNPAQDFVSIDIPGNYQNPQLSIYNLTGQLISQKQLIQPTTQIPISELGNGMYIFVIRNGDKVIGRQRVVVAR